ncbi:MAG TPA: hypothetical protein VEY95_05545 [Azospirillaceae bacterium]|nr:hypothetical protein [Azospirillaceae bacterium]
MLFGGLVRSVTPADRMILARAAGRRLLQAHGDQVLAIGVVGGSAKPERPTAPLRLSAVLKSGPATSHVFFQDGCKLVLEVAAMDDWLATAGRMDLDWPLRGPQFHDVTLLLETGDTFIELAKAEAEREAHGLAEALAEALSGEVAERALDLFHAADRPDPVRMATALPLLAWALGRLVALANLHVFRDPADWPAETAGLIQAPEGWAPFRDALAAQPAADPSVAVDAARTVLNGLPGWLRALGATTPADFPHA